MQSPITPVSRRKEKSSYEYAAPKVCDKIGRAIICCFYLPARKSTKNSRDDSDFKMRVH